MLDEQAWSEIYGVELRFEVWEPKTTDWVSVERQEFQNFAGAKSVSLHPKGPIRDYLPYPPYIQVDNFGISVIHFTPQLDTCGVLYQNAKHFLIRTYPNSPAVALFYRDNEVLSTNMELIYGLLEEVGVGSFHVG